jgi:hypothetical protein
MSQPQAPGQLRDTLAKMTGKWRKGAEQARQPSGMNDAGVAITLEACAGQIESLLAATEAGVPQAPAQLRDAAVREAVNHLRVAGLPSLTGMQVRTLERLYDRAVREMLEQQPTEPEPGHRIVSLPGSVHDFTGDPLPGYGGALITPAERYPLHALCSECHEPIRCETAESPWEHA